MFKIKCLLLFVLSLPLGLVSCLEGITLLAPLASDDGQSFDTKDDVKTVQELDAKLKENDPAGTLAKKQNEYRALLDNCRLFLNLVEQRKADDPKVQDLPKILQDYLKEQKDIWDRERKILVEIQNDLQQSDALGPGYPVGKEKLRELLKYLHSPRFQAVINEKDKGRIMQIEAAIQKKDLETDHLEALHKRFQEGLPPWGPLLETLDGALRALETYLARYKDGKFPEWLKERASSPSEWSKEQTTYVKLYKELLQLSRDISDVKPLKDRLKTCENLYGKCPHLDKVRQDIRKEARQICDKALPQIIPSENKVQLIDLKSKPVVLEGRPRVMIRFKPELLRPDLVLTKGGFEEFSIKQEDIKSIWVDANVRHDAVLRPTPQTEVAWTYNSQWRKGLKWTKTDLLKLQEQCNREDMQEAWKGEHLKLYWENLNKNLKVLIEAVQECPGLFPQGD